MIVKKIFNFILKGNRLNRLYMKFGKPTILHNRILINTGGKAKCSYSQKQFGGFSMS